MKQIQLTTGKVSRVLLAFAVPFFLANLLQAAYGAVDLFTVGRFTSTSAVSAVNIGSQVMQIITVFVMGIFTGTTVSIGNAAGRNDEERIGNVMRSSRRILAGTMLILTAALFVLAEPLTAWMQTPPEAVAETITYLRICVFGIPFIFLLNSCASVLRGFAIPRTRCTPFPWPAPSISRGPAPDRCAGARRRRRRRDRAFPPARR